MKTFIYFTLVPCLLFVFHQVDASDDEFRPIYNIPAELDRNCDLEFHQKYVDPIYRTETEKQFRLAFHSWGDALRELKKENETCFGAPQPPADGSQTYQFFYCDPHSLKCTCHPDSSKFMIQKREGSDCIFVEPELNSPCDFDRMVKANYDPVKGYHKFYQSLSQAQYLTSSRVSQVLKDHLEAKKEFVFQPWAANQICHTVDKNLECKANGKCGCLAVPPYFEYQKDGNKCVGVKGSICEMKIQSYFYWAGFWVYETLQKALCPPGLECEKAAEAGEQTLKSCGGPL